MDKPTAYPPNSRRGCEEYLFGVVNVIKALAPRAVMIAVSFSTSRKRRTTRIVKVAKKHCKIYFTAFFLNFVSIIEII